MAYPGSHLKLTQEVDMNGSLDPDDEDVRFLLMATQRRSDLVRCLRGGCHSRFTSRDALLFALNKYMACGLASCINLERNSRYYKEPKLWFIWNNVTKNEISIQPFIDVDKYSFLVASALWLRNAGMKKKKVDYLLDAAGILKATYRDMKSAGIEFTDVPDLKLEHLKALGLQFLSEAQAWYCIMDMRRTDVDAEVLCRRLYAAGEALATACTLVDPAASTVAHKWAVYMSFQSATFHAWAYAYLAKHMLGHTSEFAASFRKAFNRPTIVNEPALCAINAGLQKFNLTDLLAQEFDGIDRYKGPSIQNLEEIERVGEFLREMKRRCTGKDETVFYQATEEADLKGKKLLHVSTPGITDEGLSVEGHPYAIPPLGDRETLLKEWEEEILKGNEFSINGNEDAENQDNGSCILS